MRGGRAILVLALAGVAAIAFVVAAGAYPTWRMAGSAGLIGMAAGAGASVLAILIGLIPTAVSWQKTPAERITGMQISMAVRLVAALALALALALSGGFHRGALLIWLGISYIAGLAGESAVLALTAKRQQNTKE